MLIQFGRRRAAQNLHAEFRIDLHRKQDARIELLLQRGRISLHRGRA